MGVEGAERFTPLCPAGHLPLRGGDRLAVRFHPSQQLPMECWQRLLPISPLEGEMPGRAEGGIQQHTPTPQTKNPGCFHPGFSYGR
ncbi:lytic murein transglycosylase [Rhizobium rhizogenes]|uniref:Lytic murein transglycosylase n=1 Tax=Rhizobium rhizogenes TaxID=359 RepID=A0A546XP91_RHIRH|nr:lytic murein transglycosylase [Rhizobium rhizogenes]